MLLETAPIMFFGGKGGVGKTTLATATALRLSRDHRVCLVSTDPAHNLGHIFGTALGDAPVALTPSLSAIEIDPAAWPSTSRFSGASPASPAMYSIGR